MPARAPLLAAALAAALLAGHVATGQPLPGASPGAAAALARGEWPAYAGTYASAKYSPLDQIHRGNVASLRVAWRWASPDADLRRANPALDPSVFNESTPIMVGGVLHTSTSLSQVAAIDALTGKTRWVFDPGVHPYGTPANLGWLHRGVAYWRDGNDERVIMLTAHGFMVALDAKTGRPIPGFGDAGRVDLTTGLGRPVARPHYTHTSPPVIVRDVIVVGSSIVDVPFVPDMPPGDVRGFDVRTGKLVWTFRSVPGPGEVGHDTWENDSWTGGAWDPETSTYYATTLRLPSVITLFKPGVMASNDTYAGKFTFLPGPDNLPLFKPPWASLVAIDMTTGDHRWRAAVGNPPAAHPVLRALEVKERLGWPLRSFALATRSLVLVMQAGYHSNPRMSPVTPYRTIRDLNNRDPKLFAYDKATGALLAEIPVPANATGAPMTFMAGGKQHIAFSVGGGGIPEELIALALP